MNNNNSLTIIVVTFLLTLISSLVVQYFTNHWGFTNQVKANERQKQQEVFGQLMGRKFLTSQLYVSRFEALAYSDYHEALWKLAGHPKESLDLQEAQRWMHKSEEFVQEISENNLGLFQTVGMIRALFPSTPQLRELVDRIYRFKTPKITGPTDKMNSAQLASWKTQVVKELQELAEREYAKPIDDLLDYLAGELAKDT